MVRSLRTQIVVSTVVLTAGAMGLMALVVQLVLSSVVNRNVDQELQDRVAAVLGTVDKDNQVPDPSESSDLRSGADAMVFATDGRLLVGRIPAKLAGTVDRLKDVTQPTYRDVGSFTRLYAEPFDDGVGGVVVVAELLGPYERAETYALLVTGILGLLVTVGAGAVAALTMTRSLRPVVVMAERADDWSEHDPAQRFGLGEPTNELTALGHTLDHLLDRVSRALTTEQRLTSDIAHELRTPLTAISGSAQLGLLDDDLTEDQRTTLTEIAAAARRLDETVTTLLDLARSPDTAAGGRCTVAQVVAALEASAPAFATQVPAADRDVAVAAPLRLVERALHPVLENSSRYASGTTLRTEVAPGRVRFVVDDVGPGIDDVEGAFRPGVSRSGGAGLGLALARRVARSAGGDVDVEQSGSGARLVVWLPRP